MPFLNEELRTILADQRLDNYQDQTAVLAALKPMLEAEDLAGFKAGIKNQRVLWNQFLNPQYQIQPLADVNQQFFRNNGAANPNQQHGGGDNAANSRNSLIVLATQKRALLTLKQASDAQLEAISSEDITNADGEKALRQKFFDDQGNSLFGDPAVKIANWDPDGYFLPQPQLAELQLEAKRQLLIRKINDCDNKNALDALLRSNDQNSFTEAVKTLFGVPLAPLPRPVHPLAESLLSAELLNDRIRHPAAKKGLSKVIDRLSTDQILTGLAFLNSNAANFRNAFPSEASASSLADGDIDYIKGLFGARFLPLIASSIQTNLAELEAIAKSENPADAIAPLKRIGVLLGAGRGDYIDHSVNQSSLPAIRQAFAAQALMLKINECNDSTALDALIKVNDVNGLKQVLSSSAALGYANEPKFQEAFSDTTQVKPFVTAARISRDIAVLAQPAVLKDLIELQTHPEFTNFYLAELAKNEAQDLKNEVSAHLAANPLHVKQVRGQALVAYAKTELLKLDDAALLALVNAANANEVQVQANTLMGWTGRVPSPIDDLVGHPMPHDASISKELRVQAALAKVIKEAKAPNRDLRADAVYNALLENINNFSFNPPESAAIRNFLTAPTLAAQEKQRVQAHLVESLIRNFPRERIAAAAPPAENKLSQLAKETDLEKFKQLLTNQFGVGAHSWINKSTMEQVQKAACTRVLELGRNPRFGFQTHPQLFELIINLPLDKQRTLVGNAKAFAALTEADSKEEIERVLGGKNLANDTVINNTIEENKNLITIAEIGNSEIANTFAMLPLLAPINTAMVEEINSLLVGPPALQFDAPNYPAAIQAIVAIINPPAHIERVYDAFGLDAGGNNLVDANKQGSIDSQHRHNQHLIAAYHNAPIDPVNQTIILALLSLKKTGPFPNNRIFKNGNLNEGIVTDIKNAKTLAGFRQIINQPPGRDYKNVFNPSLERQLSPRAFERLKSQARSKALTSPEHYQQAIREMQGEYNEVATQFNDMKLEIEPQAQLKTLANWQPIQWLHLAFQANTKQNALQYGPQLREVSDQCDAYVTNLTNQLNAIQVQIASLPTTEAVNAAAPNRQIAQTINTAIDRQYERLLKLGNGINKELARYKDLQMMFQGRPDAEASEPFVRQGLLKILDQAKEAKFDLRFTDQFNIYSKDYDLSQKAERMQAQAPSPRPEGSLLGRASLESGGPLESFETIDAIPAGKFREHTVGYTRTNGAEIKGMYIEERSSANVAGKAESGVVKYEPSIKLTATKFPPASPPDDEARVYFAMAMASQLVANLKEPPTAKNPVVVRGTDPELTKYLWTALMIIGDSDKNFKFGKNEIKVVSAQFNPNEEHSMFGYRWNSEFKKKFSNNPKLGSMLAGIKEVNKLKFDKEEIKTREKVLQDTSELSRLFKTKIPRIETENKRDENDTRATLGPSGTGG